MAFVVLAGTLLVVVLPVSALTVEARWVHAGARAIGNGEAVRVLRSARFWIVAGSFALMSFSLYAVTLSAVPASVEKGLELQVAAWVLGLIGAGQVLGRLLYLAIPHPAAPWIAPASVGALGAAALTAYGIASGAAGVFVAGIVAGAIRGALTLVQASAVADRWGAHSYGRLNGALAAPVTALAALAPGVAALLAGALGSYASMAYAMAGVCALGGVLAIRR
jgi:hypothetical protein